MTLQELLSIKINNPDNEIYKLSKQRWDSLAKPLDGLGDFEDIICRTASIQGKVFPETGRKALIIMCADNGIVNEGVTQTGQEVSTEVAGLMGKNKSSVGVMTKGYPLDIFVYDVGLSGDTPSGVYDKKVCKGTQNFLSEPAMTKEECLAAIKTGIDAVEKCGDEGYGLIATGEMGIGNTTTATALLCALTGAGPESCTGRGSGLSDEGLKRKIGVIKKGLEIYTGGRIPSSKAEVFEVLHSLGGADIAALTGVFIAGALYGIPVVIDGLISAAAALVSERLIPGCREYMLASHLGREQGMKLILKELSLKSVINAELALGEGTGAVMLFPLMDMAMSLYLSGTEFESTGVERYVRY